MAQDNHSITDVHRLTDGGPIYAETDLSQWIVEPFNALSAIPFVIIALYWIIRLRKRFRQHQFLTIGSYILLIGGVGGTIYHAFRWHSVFLYMDWMPIMILTVSASVFFFVRVLSHWQYVLVIIAAYFGISFLLFGLIPPEYAHISVSVNYAMMGIFVLTPVILYLRKTHFAAGKYIVGALVAFCLALFFRVVDQDGWLPIGTHFLWHTFGAVAAHCMFLYVYSVNAPQASVLAPARS